MARAFVVANPAAGTADLDVLLPTLERHLAPAWTYDVHVTSPDEDLTALVREQVANGAEMVVAVGGDGTVRLVASGLVGSEAVLAILPGGTGNVVARDTGVPMAMDDALALINGPHTILPLDAIQVGDMYAFLNLSIGLSVGIVRDAPSEQKRRFGLLAYAWSGAKNLASIGAQDILLVVDGTEHYLRTTEILVANCPSIGLPEFRAPIQILPSDGAVQVITFRARSLGDYVHVGRDLLFDREHLSQHVRMFTALHEVRIETHEPMDVQADGDLISTTPVTVNVVPGAVRLLVPQLPS